MEARRLELQKAKAATEAGRAEMARRRRLGDAATRLQAAGRGWRARVLRSVLWHERDAAERHAAEVARRRKEEARAAAATVEAALIAESAKRQRRLAEVARRQAAEREAAEAWRRAEVERHAREKEARRARDEETARRLVEAKARHFALQERRRRAATALQAAVRGGTVRRSRGPRPEAAREIQRFVRNWLVRWRCARGAAERGAATQLQRCWRGARLRRRLCAALQAARGGDESDCEYEEAKRRAARTPYCPRHNSSRRPGASPTDHPKIGER